MQFHNDQEKEYWIECVRHAEKLDAQSGTMLAACDHRYNYTKYADEMVEELRSRGLVDNSRIMESEK